RAYAGPERRIAQRDRDAIFLRDDSLDALHGRSTSTVRFNFRNPGLSGLGGAALRGGRDHTDPFDRLAARLAQFPPTAFRGRLPLQPRSVAGKFRANRATPRRSG